MSGFCIEIVHIIDNIWRQQRTLAAVEYQIELENERLRIKEAEELQKKGVPASLRGRKPSMSINIPKFDESSIDPHTVHPDLNISSRSPEQADAVMQDGATLVEEPMSGVEGTSEEAKAITGAAPSGAAVPKESALSRTSRSSISLTSLNRHGLKLDLSNLGIDGLADSKSAITGVRPSALGAGAVSAIEAMASPVTLAPKSARPRTGYEGEYMELLQPFLDNPIDSIPLPTTVPGGASMDVPATDINMDDLFGDNEMNFSASGDGNNPATTTMDPLFSPDDMLPVKTEEMPVNLPGGETMSHEDKLLEELGFVELSSNPMASTSNTEQQNLSLDNVIGSFDFSVAPDNSLSNDFNLMQQQLQQRQQFGLDLNLTSTSGQAGQTDSSNALSDFGFDLFGGTDSNATGDELNFDIFNQPTTSDNKTN